MEPASLEPLGLAFFDLVAESDLSSNDSLDFGKVLLYIRFCEIIGIWFFVAKGLQYRDFLTEIAMYH